ncbi:MAG: succinyldiaminopimelate transaminase [Comamonadaceae bacterium]|nr:succinyldiaminopimelate transaminase [Comamonadaceae bacterium]
MNAVKNPYIDQLGPYPLAKMARLLADIPQPEGLPLIRFSIGEPKHPLPGVISEALAAAATSVNTYPVMYASEALRKAIADWLEVRFSPAKINPLTEVLPVNGAREGLFSFVQAALDSTKADALAVCPNPGYAVYDGAVILSGMQPHYVVTGGDAGIAANYAAVPAEVWKRTQLLFICSPDNPRGDTLSLDDWRTVFQLSEEYGFIIVSDECYCEIYVNGDPPLGALQAAAILGRGFERLATFFSLSKRSNAPGLRSGFIAGDAALLARVEQFRSYSGGGMNQAVEAASIAAWKDEEHVHENRELYRRKFEQVIPVLQEVLPVRVPRAGFFLWVDVRSTHLSDERFAQELMAAENVQVLPGTYLTNAQGGMDPGEGHVRMALVADIDECMEGARRIARFCRNLSAKQAFA